MNHCHDCNSDYATPGTCNCFAPGGKRCGATLTVTPPQPYYPWYPWVQPYYPPYTVWGVGGTAGNATITITNGDSTATLTNEDAERIGLAGYAVPIESAMAASSGWSFTAGGTC